MYIYSSLPKFLGVIIDRALSFGPHVAAVVSKASNRCRVLASLTSKRSGWRKDQLLKVYRALHLSVINYAGNLATLAGPNPTGPAGTLPKQSSPNHHRTAQIHPS